MNFIEIFSISSQLSFFQENYSPKSITSFKQKLLKNKSILFTFYKESKNTLLLFPKTYLSESRFSAEVIKKKQSIK